MTVADTNAVVAQIEQVPVLANAVAVSFWAANKAPSAPPWVIVHPADGIDSGDRLAGPAVTTNPSFTLHVVGATAAQAQTITGLIKDRFVTGGRFVPPAVAGRLNHAGYWRSPLPVQTDTSIVPNIAYEVIEIGWESDPA